VQWGSGAGSKSPSHLARQSMPLQQPSPADVLGTQAVLLLVWCVAFYAGFYASATRWPPKIPLAPSDWVIAFPLAIFSSWILLPRFGLTGETIVPAWVSGDSGVLNSLLLSFAIMMVAGMAIQRVVPELEAPLHAIGSGLIDRVKSAVSGLIYGKLPDSAKDRAPVAPPHAANEPAPVPIPPPHAVNKETSDPAQYHGAFESMLAEERDPGAVEQKTGAKKRPKK
jgi:hypothetical protein